MKISELSNLTQDLILICGSGTLAFLLALIITPWFTKQLITLKIGKQIRDNALESARLIANRLLEGKVGKANFKFMIKVYPHHILRENPLAAGAGADRMSTGMKMSFGKPIGIAAQVKEKQVLFTVYTNKEHLPLARRAMKLSSHKLPCSCMVVVNEPKKK